MYGYLVPGNTNGNGNHKINHIVIISEHAFKVFSNYFSSYLPEDSFGSYKLMFSLDRYTPYNFLAVKNIIVVKHFQIFICCRYYRYPILLLMLLIYIDSIGK